MALPGTPGQRISDLCNGYPVTQKEHEAEIEKIKSMLLSILWDIKQEINSKELPGETVATAMPQYIQSAAKKQQQKFRIDVTTLVT